MNPSSHSNNNSSRNQRSGDPYRVARKTHSPADSYDSSRLRSESDVHSRSASDSSTSRLASSAANYDHRRNDYYGDDPYAPRQTNHRYHMRQGTPESHDTSSSSGQLVSSPLHPKQDKANSYLPYSHHHPGRQGRSYQPPATSLYLEHEHLPSFNSPHGKDGVGSLLQDNIVMDTVDSPTVRHQRKNDELLHQQLTPIDEKQRRRCFGIGRKKLVVIAFVFIILVVVAWIFVWPRTFRMSFHDANLYNGNSQGFLRTPSGAITGMQSTWNVSMDADNADNWVPTHVSRLDVDIYDSFTNVKFASGSAGSFVLPPKTRQRVFFNVPIDYVRTPDDHTVQDLAAACVAILQPDQQEQQQQQPQQALNLRFVVTHHIAGIAWTYQTTQTAENFQCPL